MPAAVDHDRVRTGRPKRWTAEAITVAVGRWHDRYGEAPIPADWDLTAARRRGDTNRICRYEQMRPLPALQAVRREFGTFDAAVRAAGLTPRVTDGARGRRGGQLWTAEMIAAAMVGWYERHGSWPARADWDAAAARARGHQQRLTRLAEHPTPLPSPTTVLDRFGTWQRALAAAGGVQSDRGAAEQLDETVALYRQGLTSEQVGERLGISGSAVLARLDRAGEPRRGGRLTGQQRETALELHHRGWTATRIARHLDVGDDAVRGALRRAGVQLRRGRRRDSRVQQRVLALHREGRTPPQIADEVGVHADTVRRHLRAAGAR